MVSAEDTVAYRKETAMRELDLMHTAINAGDLKKALYHKKLANIAIDEMVEASRVVEDRQQQGGDGKAQPESRYRHDHRQQTS
jgi:hypothetical protein